MRRQFIEAVWTDLSGGDGAGLVVLRGAAGIGKSTIAEAIADRWRREHGTVHAVFGGVAQRALPFGALLHLLPPDQPVARSEIELSQVLRRQLIAPQRPLIVVEAIDTLDTASMGLIESIVNQQEARVLGTIEAPATGADLLPETTTVREIAPLDPAEVTTMIVDEWGAGDDESITLLLEQAAGNPLHLLELMKAAEADGTVVRSAGTWRLSAPPGPTATLERLVRRHVERLSPGQARVLRTIAAMGPLPRAMLDDIDVDATAALQADRLVTDDPVRITQPVFARALADDPNTDLAALGAPIAEAARQGHEIDPAQLGRWSREAGVTLDATTRRRAAHRAIRQLDHDLALHLLDGLDDPSEDDLVTLATARSRIGDVEGAMAAAEGAMERTSDEELLVTAALLMSDLHFLHRGEIPEAIALLDTIGRRVETAAARVRIDAALALFALLTGDADLAQDAGRTALAETELPPGARLEVLVTSTFAQVLNGQLLTVDAALDETTALIDRLDSIGDEGTRASLTRALQLLHLGQIAEATRFVDRWLDDDTGRSEAAAVWHCLAGDFARLIGDTNGARRHFQRAVEEAGTVDDLGALGLSLAELAALEVETGTAGEPSIDEVMAEYGHDIRAFGRGARGLVRAAPISEADATGDALAEQATRMGAAIWALWIAYEATRRAPAPVSAARLSTLAEVVEGPLPSLMVDHAHGLVEHDVERLAAAADGFAELGLIVPACEALCHEIEALRHDMQGEQARRRLARHQDLIAALPVDGGHVVGARLRDAAAAIDPLTPRQRDVVGLARQGMASREIADELDLSVRTVDNHLAAAYRKLGVRSRDDL